MEFSELKDVDYVAKILGVSPVTIRRLVVKRQIASIVVGNQYRFTDEMIADYLNANTNRRGG